MHLPPGFYRLHLHGGPLDGAILPFQFLPRGELPRIHYLPDSCVSGLIHAYRYRPSLATAPADMSADFISPLVDCS